MEDLCREFHNARPSFPNNVFVYLESELPIMCLFALSFVLTYKNTTERYNKLSFIMP